MGSIESIPLVRWIAACFGCTKLALNCKYDRNSFALYIVRPAMTVEKFKLLSSSHDLSAATYQIHDETHTIGNPLRWMLMKNPKVEFCGYSAPHPSENVINVRIQMYDKLSSLDALIDALANLDKVCETVEDKYLNSLIGDPFERWEEKS